MISKNKLFVVIAIFLFGYLIGGLFGFPGFLKQSYENCVIERLYNAQANENIGTFENYTLNEILSADTETKKMVVSELETISEEYNIQDMSENDKDTYITVNTAFKVCSE